MIDLTSIPTIKALLDAHGAGPQKRLGQSFLVSRAHLERIVSALHPAKDDTIVEVGSGIGALTLELSQKAARLVALEKDSAMIEILRDVLERERISNVELLQKDARFVSDTDIENWNLRSPVPSSALVSGKIENSRYKVAGNLPYYAATPIVQTFLALWHRPARMVFTVQKEVGERMTAKPPRMNILGLSVQFYADASLEGTIPSSSFWPKPEVEGAIITIVPHTDRPQKEIEQMFFQTIKAGFRHPRKKLINNLISLASKEKVANAFQSLGVSPDSRPAELSLEAWKKLSLLLPS